MAKGMSNSTASIIRRAISFTLLVVILGVTGVYIVNHADDLRSVLNVSLVNLVMLSLLDILFIGLNGVRIKVLTDIFGVHLRSLEWLGLSAANSLLNYLPAQGGTITRGAYLRRAHNLPLSAFAASVAASYLITFMTMGILGLIAMLGVFLSRGLVSLELTGLLVALILASLLMMRVRWPARLQAEGPILSRLKRVWDVWLIIRRHRRTVAELVLLDVLGGMTYACRLILSFQIVSVTVTLWMAMAMAPLAMLTIVISLTPGALGIKEAVVGWGAAMLGASAARGIQAATADRLIMVVWMAILGVLFSLRLPSLLRDVLRQRGQTISEL